MAVFLPKRLWGLSIFAARQLMARWDWLADESVALAKRAGRMAEPSFFLAMQNVFLSFDLLWYNIVR
jgi:hypothetical protein